MLYHPLKDTIYHYRNIIGLSQKALANISCVPQYHFTNINNDKEISTPILESVCKALSVTKDELLKQPISNRIRTLKGDLFVNQYPHLLKHLNKTKNQNINIDEISTLSSIDLIWDCTSCKEPFKRSATYYAKMQGTVNFGLCLPCGQGQIKGSSFLVNDLPEIAEEFHPTKNIRDINEIGTYSSIMLFWLCKDCGHTWLDTPYSRGHSVKKKGCPSCENESLNKKAIDTIAFYEGELLDRKNEKYKIRCSSGHVFVKTRSELLDYEWCSTCRDNKRRKFSTVNTTTFHDEFISALKSQNFSLLDNEILGITKEHKCICPEGHETPITPKKAINAVKSSKPIECYTCKKNGKYRKQYYKSAEEIIKAINRLQIKSTREFRERFKEDPMLGVRQLTEFPEIKAYLSKTSETP